MNPLTVLSAFRKAVALASEENFRISMLPESSIFDEEIDYRDRKARQEKRFENRLTAYIKNTQADTDQYNAGFLAYAQGLHLDDQPTYNPYDADTWQLGFMVSTYPLLYKALNRLYTATITRLPEHMQLAQSEARYILNRTAKG